MARFIHPSTTAPNTIYARLGRSSHNDVSPLINLSSTVDSSESDQTLILGLFGLVVGVLAVILAFLQLQKMHRGEGDRRSCVVSSVRVLWSRYLQFGHQVFGMA